MPESEVMDIVAEDGSSLVMENQENAGYYYNQIVQHWNESVDGIIQMGKKLNLAKANCTEEQFSILENRLEREGILSKAVQKKLGLIGKSQTVNGHYRQCVSNGVKPSLPNNWTTLYAITQLDEKDFSLGVDCGIIGMNTTAGDVNQLKAQTHPSLPNAKKPMKNGSAASLEGKVIAKVAVKIDELTSEDEARKINKELENAIADVVEKYSGKIDNSFVNVLDEFKTHQEKLAKRKESQKKKIASKTTSFLSDIAELDEETLANLTAQDKKKMQQLLSKFN